MEAREESNCFKNIFTMRVGWEIHKYTVLSINDLGLFTAENVQMPDLCLYRLLATGIANLLVRSDFVSP